jgi:hypothetical protein
MGHFLFNYMMIQESDKVFKPLTKEEERVLEMYSRGESYEVIQENLYLEHGMEYSKKKLGHKMGEIKKKMNCETQFQMGYLYGRRESKISTPKKELTFDDVRRIALEYNRGLNAGLVMASVFWLIIYALISNYIN